MDLEKKLVEGMEFLNYSDMCTKLGLEIKNSTNSKNAQFKELARYCNYVKNGHKIKLIEVYDIVKDKVHGNSGNHNGSKTTPLTITNPRLSKQWNSDKNGALTEDVTNTNTEYHWWTCDACSNEINLPANKRFHSNKPSNDDNITCPACWLSKHASRIYVSLIKSNVDFRLEHTFEDLTGLKGKKLRFDFAIFNNDQLLGLIEYDGGFHDNNEVYYLHDKLKDEFCKDIGIPLLRVHHTSNTTLYSQLLDFLNRLNFFFDEEYLSVECAKEKDEYYQRLIKLKDEKELMLKRLSNIELEIDAIESLNLKIYK